MPFLSVVLFAGIALGAAVAAVVAGVPWPIAMLTGLIAPAVAGGIYLRATDQNAPTRRLRPNDPRTDRFVAVLAKRYRAAGLKDLSDQLDGALAAYRSGAVTNAERSFARVSAAVAHHPMANPLISAWQRAWKDAAKESVDGGGRFVADRAGCRLIIDEDEVTVTVSGDTVVLPVTSIRAVHVVPWRHILTVAAVTDSGTYQWAFADQTLEVAAALSAAAAAASGSADGDALPLTPPRDEFGPSSELVKAYLASLAAVTSEGWRTVISEWIWLKADPAHAAAWDEAMKLAALRTSQVGLEASCRRANEAARRVAASRILAVADQNLSDAQRALLSKDVELMVGSIGALLAVSHELIPSAIEAAFWPIQAVIPPPQPRPPRAGT